MPRTIPANGVPHTGAAYRGWVERISAYSLVRPEGNNIEFKRRTDKKVQIMQLGGIVVHLMQTVDEEIGRES